LLKLDTESGEKQLLTEKEKSMPASKEKALNLATS